MTNTTCVGVRLNSTACECAQFPSELLVCVVINSWNSGRGTRPDECWALEYARGHIPTMMPFGLWDTFFSTVDFYTMWQTVRISASQMLAEALQGKF